MRRKDMGFCNRLLPGCARTESMKIEGPQAASLLYLFGGLK